MSVFSKIKIKFTQELTLGQQCGFDIYVSSSFGSPYTYPRVEQVVTTRAGAGQMTRATSSTSIIGERTAINYLTAVQADLGTGYIYSRNANEVTIQYNHTPSAIIEFIVNGSLASYTNPNSIQFTIENSVTDFTLIGITFSATGTPCRNVNVQIQTSVTASTIHSPIISTVSTNPFSFQWNRGATFSLVVTNSSGRTASTTITTPAVLTSNDFTFDNLYSILTVNNVGATGLSLSYSLDGENWQSGKTFSNVSDSYTVYVKDQFGCSFSHTETVFLNPSNLILAGNPYYVTYNALPSSFDYCTLELYVWNGENITPATYRYPLTSYKANDADDFIYFQIEDYIKSYLDPKVDSTWYAETAFTADTTLITADNDYITVDTTFLNSSSSNLYGEVCWVRWILRAYKIAYGVGVISEVIQSPLHFATLGKGYHSEGANPTINRTTLIDPSDKFATTDTINYLTTINIEATNTNQIIKREVGQPENITCSHQHRELQILYLNKLGVWDSMLVNRVSKRAVNIKSEKYDFYQSKPHIYNTNVATSRISNIDVVEEWILNTPLLNESQNRYIEELTTSDRWYLLDHRNNLLTPVIYVDKRYDEKLSIYDKAKIQWTLKFEGANSKINDIQ